MMDSQDKQKLRSLYLARMKKAVTGIFAGPMMIVFGQAVVWNFDLKTVGGWTVTVTGIAILIISIGFGLFSAIDYSDQTR